MKPIKQLFAAFALVAAASTLAVAQSDYGSPLGAGAGLGGSVAPNGVPGAGSAIPQRARDGWETSKNNFANAPALGARVLNPAGGNVNLPQNVARALGAVLGGGGSAGDRGVVAQAAGGNNALVEAVANLGANPTMNNLRRAVSLYNAAIDAVPAGQAPSAALLAIRQALFAASQS